MRTQDTPTLNAVFKRGDISLKTITYLDDEGKERAAWTSKEAGTDDALLPDYLAELDPSEEWVVLPFEEAVREVHSNRNRSFCEPPRSISSEEWHTALEVLPPEGWERNKGVEGFCSSEFLIGNLTSHYVRCNDLCLVAVRPFRTSYAEILREFLTGEGGAKQGTPQFGCLKGKIEGIKESFCEEEGGAK